MKGAGNCALSVSLNIIFGWIEFNNKLPYTDVSKSPLFIPDKRFDTPNENAFEYPASVSVKYKSDPLGDT